MYADLKIYCNFALQLCVLEINLTKYNFKKMAFELTDSNFKEKVIDQAGITVVDFWAEWCGPCRMIGPHIEEMAKEYDGKALIAKVNVDNNPEISYKYNVRNIPTILYLKNGEVVDKQIGATSKKVLSDKLEAILAL
jgi:thioredoxin 1